VAQTQTRCAGQHPDGGYASARRSRDRSGYRCHPTLGGRPTGRFCGRVEVGFVETAAGMPPQAMPPRWTAASDPGGITARVMLCRTGFLMQQATRLMITNEQVDLLSVSGRLDGAGLQVLQQQVDLLLDAGARLLLADLSRVERCESQVFDLLARISDLVHRRGGWLRLVVPGSSTVSTVDQTALPAALPMDSTSDRGHRAGGRA
jgi:anti-anti-sigma regulatory factor